MDGTCYPSELRPQDRQRSTWLSALVGSGGGGGEGGLLMGGGEQHEGCQPSGCTEEVPSVCFGFCGGVSHSGSSSLFVFYKLNHISVLIIIIIQLFSNTC